MRIILLLSVLLLVACTPKVVEEVAVTESVTEKVDDTKVEDESKVVTKKLNLPKEETKKYAEMTFEKELHDFGTISVGDSVSFIFKFKNTGDIDLDLEFVSGSCGCTVPSYPDQPIPPGESGEIKVTFNSAGKDPGLNENDVTIIANIPEEVKILQIKAVVKE